jgi:uncharacterized MAPEG superfamily protein
MTTDLTLAAYAVALTWLMVMSAAMIKSRTWSFAGLKVAVGNREALDAPTGVAGRADRAGKNMVENLPLFLGLVMVAHLGGRDGDRVVLGAHVWFWARVAYWPVYLVGIPYVRTLIWNVSIVGLAIIFTALV